MALEVCDGSGGPTKALRRVVIALSKTEQEWRDGPTPCGAGGAGGVSSELWLWVIADHRRQN